MENNIRVMQAEKRRIENGATQTKLEKVRISRKISQGKLAELANIKVSTIRTYEQHVRPIDNANFATILNICLALHCSPVDILEEEDTIQKFNQIMSFDTEEAPTIPCDDKFFVETELYNYYFGSSPLADDEQLNKINTIMKDRLKKILSLRYENCMTFADIGQAIGVSAGYAHQQIKKGLRIMRVIRGFNEEADE